MRRSFERIGAIIMRHVYLLKSSWTRVIEQSLWPMFSMIIWGFTGRYFAQHMASNIYGISVIIAAAILWEFLLRAQLGLVRAYLEEVWSRNVGHLFISPLRTWEWITSLITLSTLQSFISVVPVALVSFFFFKFNLLSFGWPLIGFLLCLIPMGWWLGFIAISIVVQFGAGAEMLAWMMTYAIAPICAAFYPVVILPAWLHPIAFLVPASHVFEAMRAMLTQHQFDVTELFWAFGLNIFYLILSGWILLRSLRDARNRGALLVVGE